jgi:hypothetical protein
VGNGGASQTGAGGTQQAVGQTAVGEPTQAPLYATVPNIAGGVSNNFPIVPGSTINTKIQLQVVTTDLANDASFASIKANTVALVIAEAGGMITASDILDVMVETRVNRNRVRRQSKTTSVTVVMEEVVPLFAATAAAESIHSAADATDFGIGFVVDGFNFVIGAVERVIDVSDPADSVRSHHSAHDHSAHDQDHSARDHSSRNGHNVAAIRQGAESASNGGSRWIVHGFGALLGVVGTVVWIKYRGERPLNSTNAGGDGPTENSLLLSTSSLSTLESPTSRLESGYRTQFITSPSQAEGRATMSPRRRSPRGAGRASASPTNKLARPDTFSM